MSEIQRCGWVNLNDPLYVAYHDQEWGVPLRGNDNALFERIVLEGAQAGLSWITVLRKREHYRQVFDNFDPEKVALYDESKVNQLMGDSGIIRNRAKILSAVNNARQFMKIQQESGSFSSYLWSFVGDQPIQNQWHSLRDIPSETEISKRLSKDLKQRGFKFVGSTICYAMMQACGLVNDHAVNCFRREEVKAL
ncbi:MAG: DNA-3-methyladenine glycosylase I [Anaerolineae bacterium]|nr:DNA-3-methyladenine glycosylase I [Anaerolineae bacterium]